MMNREMGHFQAGQCGSNILDKVNQKAGSDDQSECAFCNRKPQTIICRTCGHVFKGRVRSRCASHGDILFLMDYVNCPQRSCHSLTLSEVSDANGSRQEGLRQAAIPHALPQAFDAAGSRQEGLRQAVMPHALPQAFDAAGSRQGAFQQAAIPPTFTLQGAYDEPGPSQAARSGQLPQNRESSVVCQPEFSKIKSKNDCSKGSRFADDLRGNPVDELYQNAAMWLSCFPVYTFTYRQGEFICMVRLGLGPMTRTARGSGHSKKLAKRSAAAAMLRAIGFYKESGQIPLEVEQSEDMDL